MIAAPFAVRTDAYNEVQPDVLVARFDELTKCGQQAAVRSGTRCVRELDGACRAATEARRDGADGFPRPAGCGQPRLG